MIKEYQLKENGLVLPVEPPEKPERIYGPLEVQSDWDRKDLQKYFTKILNLGCIRGGMMCDTHEHKQIVETRQNVIIHLAKLLLGDDFSYEELC